MDQVEVLKKLIDNIDVEVLKKGGWIQKAINPKHKGYCTPMTKKTCTPRRKALAKRFKSGDLSKKEQGGKMKYQDGGQFKYPDTSERFSKFKQTLEGDERSKDFARLYHYKTLLDKALQAKDSAGFQSAVSAAPKNLQERIAYADNLYGKGMYKAYLDIPEMQKALGQSYQDYTALMNKYRRPQMGIAGSNEQPGQNAQDLRYGLRSSLSINPYQLDEVVQGQGQPKATFKANVYYKPDSSSYAYQYQQPQEFQNGGKLNVEMSADGIKLDDFRQKLNNIIKKGGL